MIRRRSRPGRGPCPTTRSLVRSRPRPPRRPVLRHGPRRRPGPTRRHALYVRGDLAAHRHRHRHRRRTRPPGSRQRRDPRQAARPTPHHYRRLPRRTRQRQLPAPPCRGPTRLLLLGCRRTAPLPTHRARLRLARRPLGGGSGGDGVVSWGDARIGNVGYDGFEPAAVFDCEMAALGPRELDLGWLVYLHRFFQDRTESGGEPGLPDFLRRDRVESRYARLTGHRPRHMEFHTLSAALRHAVVMLRVAYRQVYFGEIPAPAGADGLILHRDTLEAMLAGRYR
ncbi:phosphotransferase [Streptomyces sp. YGL11-2]|uniref:phosphotransferase n=1 Tax=Streptomyces sp. YGL11-2 TaxID=3414028 RepID=UPI003CEC3ABE